MQLGELPSSSPKGHVLGTYPSTTGTNLEVLTGVEYQTYKRSIRSIKHDLQHHKTNHGLATKVQWRWIARVCYKRETETGVRFDEVELWHDTRSFHLP
jgi:hypothetical protein